MQEHTIGQKLFAYFVLGLPPALFCYGTFAPLFRHML